MPRPRFQRAPQEKREAVLDAAAKEFALHGYDDASVNRILLAAGFSKGAFYYYFDDKADLAIAVLEREAVRNLELLPDAPSSASPEAFWADVERIATTSIARLRAAPHANTEAFLRLGTAISRHPELMERLSTSLVRDSMSKVTQMWQQGQDIGAVRTDIPLPKLLLLIQDVKIALVRALLPQDRAPKDEELIAFVRIHLYLVRRIAQR
jgi:AcrR family transcriptional regulator